MAGSSETERKPFKDYFDGTAATMLASQMEHAWPEFDSARFIKSATQGIAQLEFNDRVRQFGDALSQCLPHDKAEALDIVRRSLPAPLPDCNSVTDGWLQWPVGQFIADYGTEHFEPSMRTMIELTQRFSSEYAIRPFVELYPKQTFDLLTELTEHESPHVRRWCSEGVRTRLPWAKKIRFLIDDPRPIWPLLDALKDDPELYVRRSVANSLNDLAKDHADAVIAKCKRWSRDATPERRWVIERGLRSLIKDGSPGALEVVGFKPVRSLDATLKLDRRTVTMGSAIELRLDLHNRARAPQALLIDYVIDFVRKNGRTVSKVFKWKTVELGAGEKLSLDKRHGFKQARTRALYPGNHGVGVQINGVRVANAEVTLKTS